MESRGIRRVAFALTTVSLTLSAVPLHALDGSVTPIVVPDNVVPHTTRTDAFGINERGQIVGSYGDSASLRHGFLLDGDTWTTAIDVPGATNTDITGINNRGQLVGMYSAGSHFHGFLWDRGTFTFPIDAPGATDTFANGINDQGQVVGFYLDAGGASHGFLLDGASSPRSMSRAARAPRPSGSMAAGRSSAATTTPPESTAFC